MEEVRIRNLAELRGVLAAAPVFSHMSRGERFFIFPIETRRLSGARGQDKRGGAGVAAGRRADRGDGLPAHNGRAALLHNKRGEGAKLVITVFARSIAFDEGEDINRVALTGTLCKPPNLRITPKGRDICDLMLAVNRRCGRSDYLPCICWGRRARDAALLGVGDRLSLCGRIQSRPYIKVIDGIQVDKVAFEVSVTELEPLDP